MNLDRKEPLGNIRINQLWGERLNKSHVWVTLFGATHRREESHLLEVQYWDSGSLS